MLESLRENGLDSLFKEVKVFKAEPVRVSLDPLFIAKKPLVSVYLKGA